MENNLLTQLHNMGDRLLASDNLLFETDKETANGIMSDCCRIIGGEYENSLKEKYLSILFKLAYREDNTLEECWQIYWNINRALFVNFNLKPANVVLSELYGYIFDTVHSYIDYSNLSFREKSLRNRKTIVMTTSQFLGQRHAPTQRVLDYAYTLQHNLGFNVIIINDAGMHYIEHPHLSGVVSFNYKNELGQTEHIEYKDESFEFLQVGCVMPDIDVISELLHIIYEINPILVYNVGGSSLVTDLCTDFVTTCSMPCSLQLPVTLGNYLLLARNLEERDNDDLNRLRPHQKVVESNFNYIYRHSDKVYSRSEFGIPEDEFVMCVVGNRLGDEISTPFLKMLGYVLANAAPHKIGIAFIGPIEEAKKAFIFEELRTQFLLSSNTFDNDCSKDLSSDSDWNKKAPLTYHVYFTGSVKEAAELIKHMNLCINPDRSGGGRAFFEAYCHGIPSVSLRKGDAYYVGGPDFGADNYENYAQIILEYLNDAQKYNSACNKASERSLLLSDMVGTQKAILKNLNCL